MRALSKKMVQGLVIAALSIVSLVFLIMGNLDIAVLFMTLLFICTNSFRYRQMKEQGMDREAKWMLGMAVIFVIMFLAVLAMILI
jgi:cbb3-type cytochrome oxidase subunit 3